MVRTLMFVYVKSNLPLLTLHVTSGKFQILKSTPSLAWERLLGAATLIFESCSSCTRAVVSLQSSPACREQPLSSISVPVPAHAQPVSQRDTDIGRIVLFLMGMQSRQHMFNLAVRHPAHQ